MPTLPPLQNSLHGLKKTCVKVKVAFVSKETVLKNWKENLEKRFARATAVPNIRKQHCLVPMQDNLMSIARDSYGAGFQVVDLTPMAQPRKKKEVNYYCF